jgi:hypothetical protein
MAHSAASLIALACAAALPLAAQERPPADPLAGATPKPEARTGGDRPAQRLGGPEGRAGGPFRRPLLNGPEAEKAREAIRDMKPEERQQWLRRFREFADLPPEQKKTLLDREEMFRKRMREDTEAALKQSGLTLDEEQRRRFAARYAEERRKIEEELRAEIEKLRQPRVQSLIEKLKQEFASPGAP